jgi:hypothetical protein
MRHVVRHTKEGSIRLTPKQKQLLAHLQREGKGKRGRWVRSFPPRTKTVTISSLLNRGLVEERFVSIPQHKWPKERDPFVVGYNYQELRLTK